MSNVQQYWSSFWAKREKPGSQNDFFFQSLSTNAILRFLKPEYYVLNVGCGDGYGFDKYCEASKKVVGLDYSPEAIEKANIQYKDLVKIGKAEFIVGNILNIEPSLQGYDALDGIRTSLNLPPIKRHWHNVLINEEIFKDLKAYEIIEKHTFCPSKYYETPFKYGFSPIVVLSHPFGGVSKT
ncbi:MAG: class I SAM-dependent methyltransferase [Candidatus Poribacteria bacterium]